MNQTISVKLAFGVVIFSVLSSLVIASIIAAAGTVQPDETSQNTYNYIALFVGQGFMVIPLFLFLISRKEPIINSLRLKLISGSTLLSAFCISMGLIPIVDEMDRILSFVFGTEEELAQLTDILIIDYSFIGLLLSTTIVVLVAINQPFTLWLLYSFFKTIPKELDESALIDGCSYFQAFRHIIMPVMWPGVITAGLFSLMLAYNDFTVTALLLNQENHTMVPKIQSYLGTNQHEGNLMWAVSAVVSATAPLFMLVMFFQRQVISGLTTGAVKG